MCVCMYVCMYVCKYVFITKCSYLLHEHSMKMDYTNTHMLLVKYIEEKATYIINISCILILLCINIPLREKVTDHMHNLHT